MLRTRSGPRTRRIRSAPMPTGWDGRPTSRRAARRSAWWRTTGGGSPWRWARRIATTRVRPGCSRCGSRPTRVSAGIGRALVERVVDWARSRDFPVLRLLVTVTNDAAVRPVRRDADSPTRAAAPAPRRIRHRHDVHEDGPVGVSERSRPAGRRADPLLRRPGERVRGPVVPPRSVRHGSGLQRRLVPGDRARRGRGRRVRCRAAACWSWRAARASGRDGSRHAPGDWWRWIRRRA